MPDIETPVLIVGAGPAGLTTALALARYGVECVVMEKYSGPAHTPRAHIVNQRTVEIWRHLGIEERLLAAATPQEMMRNNLWVTTLDGVEVARSETWGTSDDRAAEYRSSSPSPMVNCPQTVFEPILIDEAQAAGVDLRFQHEFLSFTQNEGSVDSVVRNRVTGETLTVRSQYLIGSDGARSRVLEQAGLTVDGPSGLAHAANIWFRADLSEYLAYRPGVLTWSVAPGPLPPLRLGVLICHKPFTEFVLVNMYEPGTANVMAESREDLVRRVHAFIGNDRIDVEILDCASWTVSAQVAPQYSAGRVFCLGDAVHRHPPTNGLGLNMSTADGFNLAWKLALVVQGKAGPGLLETYSAERQPVGAAGIARAITSLGEAAEIDRALGLAPGQSVEDGWKELEQLHQPGSVGDRKRADLNAAVRLSDNQFNAHGIELGYRYVDGALAAETIETSAADERDAVLTYTPTTRPGARVPHARLQRGREVVSTLDLVEGTHLTLFTGVGGEEWSAAAAAAEKATGLTIDVHVIGRHDGLTDPYNDWADRREVESDGCVLVRPDRHVAWRCNRITDAAGADLTEVLARFIAQRAPSDQLASVAV
ncbi:FAD-dependent monooxygenase [Actinomycetes bacterium M1A6_2h]